MCISKDLEEILQINKIVEEENLTLKDDIEKAYLVSKNEIQDIENLVISNLKHSCKVHESTIEQLTNKIYNFQGKMDYLIENLSQTFYSKIMQQLMNIENLNSIFQQIIIKNAQNQQTLKILEKENKKITEEYKNFQDRSAKENKLSIAIENARNNLNISREEIYKIIKNSNSKMIMEVFLEKMQYFETAIENIFDPQAQFRNSFPNTSEEYTLLTEENQILKEKISDILENHKGIIQKEEEIRENLNKDNKRLRQKIKKIQKIQEKNKGLLLIDPTKFKPVITNLIKIHENNMHDTIQAQFTSKLEDLQEKIEILSSSFNNYKEDYNNLKENTMIDKELNEKTIINLTNDLENTRIILEDYKNKISEFSKDVALLISKNKNLEKANEGHSQKEF